MPQLPRPIRLDREAHRDRFFRLLLILLASFLVSGLGGGVMTRLVAGVLNIVAIVVCMLATGFPSWVPTRIVGSVLIVLAAAALATAPINSDVSHGISATCAAIVLGSLLCVVVYRILTHNDVQMQTIAGAICAYILIGLLFSSIYAAFDYFGSGQFFNHPMTPPDYGYFSFTTLTTVGYGDFVIVANFGRRLANLESLLGQVFLATAVARIVSGARWGPAGSIIETETEET